MTINTDHESASLFQAQQTLRRMDISVKIALLLREFSCPERKEIKALVYKHLSMSDD